MISVPGLTIHHVDTLDMRFEAKPGLFSVEERASIDAFYAQRLRENPALWNGDVLILAQHDFDQGQLTGVYAQSDYASMLWLLHGQSPHRVIRACFPMGALCGADGGFVLVRMASWTANAGRIYFAAGTPDLSDITAQGQVDLEASLLRELAEETGVHAAEARLEPGWTALCDERRIALMRQVILDEDTERLAARIRTFAASDERSEIAEVIVMRHPRDFREGLSPMLRAYLERLMP